MDQDLGDQGRGVTGLVGAEPVAAEQRALGRGADLLLVVGGQHQQHGRGLAHGPQRGTGGAAHHVGVHGAVLGCVAEAHEHDLLDLEALDPGQAERVRRLAREVQRLRGRFQRVDAVRGKVVDRDGRTVGTAHHPDDGGVGADRRQPSAAQRGAGDGGVVGSAHRAPRSARLGGGGVWVGAGA